MTDQNDADRELSNLNMLRGLQSDERSKDNTDRAYNYGVYSDNRDYTAREAQQTKENTWYEEQVASGVKQQALQAAMSNALSQSQWGVRRQPPVADEGSRTSGRNLEYWRELVDRTKHLSCNRTAQKEQYRKTGKGGAAVANYETYFDYMTGLTDYYAAQLK